MLHLKIMLFLVFGFHSLSYAQNDSDRPPFFRVLQLKGNKAIIEYSKKSTPLAVGEKGFITQSKTTPFDESTLEENQITGSRDRFVSISTELAMLSTKSGSSSAKVDAFALDLAYGWNKGTLEYGALFTYEFEKLTNTDSKTILIGGLVDYNLSPNILTQKSLYGARLVLQVGQLDNSTQSQAGNLLRIEPGAFIKWFGLDDNLALIGQLSYRIENYTVNSVKVETTGLRGQFGIQAYF